jgi:uncharacterized integral membrane protein
LIGFEDVSLAIGQPLVERPLHKAVFVEDQAVEHQEFDDWGSVGIYVFHQFSIEYGVCVKAMEGWVLVVWKMQARDIVVVIFAVDEVVDVSVAILSEVHQIPQAICLLTHVVVLSLQFLNVFRGKRDWLSAREGPVLASKQLCDF